MSAEVAKTDDSQQEQQEVDRAAKAVISIGARIPRAVQLARAIIIRFGAEGKTGDALDVYMAEIAKWLEDKSGLASAVERLCNIEPIDSVLTSMNCEPWSSIPTGANHVSVRWRSDPSANEIRTLIAHLHCLRRDTEKAESTAPSSETLADE